MEDSNLLRINKFTILQHIFGISLSSQLKTIFRRRLSTFTLVCIILSTIVLTSVTAAPRLTILQIDQKMDLDLLQSIVVFNTFFY